MQSQLQKQSLAASHNTQSLAPSENAYHQKLSQRENEYTWNDVDKYTLIPGTVMGIISAILGWLLSFVLHPVVASILAIALFVLSFVVYLRVRNGRRAAREIYDEQNQDIDALIKERPNLIDKIQELSEYRYRFLILEMESRKSPYHELPDNLKSEAEKLKKKIRPYLDDEVKEYLAEHNNDAAHINAIIVTLERLIKAEKQPPQLISRKVIK